MFFYLACLHSDEDALSVIPMFELNKIKIQVPNI